MANTKMRLDDIDRQTSDLAGAIKRAIDEMTGQLADLQARHDRLTGGAVRRGPGRPKGSSNSGSSNSGSSNSGSSNSGSSNSASSAPASSATKSAKAAKPGKKKRIRRTREQLKVMADDIFGFVKKGGSDGVKGSAIKKEFGTLLPSIKEFLKAYGGKTVKTKGQKAAMTYHHD